MSDEAMKSNETKDLSIPGKKQYYRDLGRPVTGKLVALLEKGTAPFLPNSKGELNTDPVRYAISGRLPRGMSYIMLKTEQVERNYQSPDFVTAHQATKAGTVVKLGQPSLTVSSFDAETKEVKEYRYFNAEQCQHPDRITRLQEGKDAIRHIQGTERENVAITSSEPSEYLGQWFAAISRGANCTVQSEVANEFKSRLHDELSHGIRENNFTVGFRIANAASNHCKEVLREHYRENRTEKHQSHTMEMEQ